MGGGRAGVPASLPASPPFARSLVPRSIQQARRGGGDASHPRTDPYTPPSPLPGCCTKCIPVGEFCSTAPYAKRCCGLAECLPDAATGKHTCQVTPPPNCVPYGQPCNPNGGLDCCDDNAVCQVPGGTPPGTPAVCNGW